MKARPDVCIKGAEDFLTWSAHRRQLGQRRQMEAVVTPIANFFMPQDFVNRDQHDRVAKTVPGTTKLHPVVGAHSGLIYTHRFSCTCVQCRDGHHLQCSERQVATSPVLLQRDDHQPWPVPVTSHCKHSIALQCSSSKAWQLILLECISCSW